MTEPPWDALRALVHEIRDEVVVVKNPDIWGSLERGGDWDLVTIDPDRAAATVTSVLGPPESDVRRSYVWSLNYPWGHLDLLPGVEWRGFTLVPAQDVVAGAWEGPHGSLRFARPAHQVMAACLYPVLAHGGYRDRYLALWRASWVSDADELRRRLAAAFGDLDVGPATSATELAGRQAELRRRLVTTGLRDRPRTVLGGVTRFVAAEAKVRLQG